MLSPTFFINVFYLDLFCIHVCVDDVIEKIYLSIHLSIYLSIYIYIYTFCFIHFLLICIWLEWFNVR